MIGRIETFLRKLRRRFSRSEWLATLLKLPRSESEPTAPGLIMIQVDGLSHHQLNYALDHGEMPFLKRLLQREHYRLHPQFSGVPSTTSAFQSELFYGVKNAVPGFAFKDKTSDRLVQMIEPATATAIERMLANQGGKPLLKGGSNYADNYTGGADETHFCPASPGWGSGFRTRNPLLILFFILTNIYSFLRIGVLLLVEVVLAITDFIRGLFDRQDLIKEFKFVPIRVAISILLRELVTIGTKIDLARGQPVIHLNFLGYDEQSHRRGPSSLFAHWTLKGIDDAIARIWRAAHRSQHRHYDVWIYSDHGQQTVEPYQNLHGRTLEEAVLETFSHIEPDITTLTSSNNKAGIQTQRARLLSNKLMQGIHSQHSVDDQLSLAAVGPIGFIYCKRDFAPDVRAQLAQGLARKARVPLVLSKDDAGNVIAWTDQGSFNLPQQADEILGADHPYLQQVAAELIALCHQQNAGSFVLCGWRVGVTPCSFANENGAHGGAGPEETNAFALLPADAPLPDIMQHHLSASDLRHAALHFMGRIDESTTQQPKCPAKMPLGARAKAENTLRIMTYNVHSCVGMDGKLSPERIARVIARYKPDVVALQELDVGRARTDSIDQAHLIAQYLKMDFHFHPAMHIEEERYGDAILTHLPMRLIKADSLPTLAAKSYLEPRGAIWVAIEMNGIEIHIMNTHLGMLTREREAQTTALLGPDWLEHPDCYGPTILCGDFNALPSSNVCHRLRSRLNDAQIKLDLHRPRSTFFGRMPTLRIDHVFLDPSIEVINIEVPNTELACTASDHLPLIVEVTFPPVSN